MTTFKHTPEPWSVNSFNARTGGYLVADTVEPNICEMSSSLPPGSVSENANRIVACVNGCKGIQDPETTVPELLAALYKIDANAAESVEWIRRVTRAAIAKATGETK